MKEQYMSDDWIADKVAAGWEIDYVKLALRSLREHLQHAEEEYQASKDAGHDVGRIAGLMEAISILQRRSID